MPRFFIPPEQIKGSFFHLEGPEAHHALSVLRKKVGDTLDLFDGQNLSFQGRIERIEGLRVFGQILTQRSGLPLFPISVTLFQSLMKMPKWDWFIEKVTEIGVARVIPLLTERSVVKVSSHELNRKVERWRRIALAAAKQCGRSDLMVVESPQKYDEALSHIPVELALLPWEKESSRTIRNACEHRQPKTLGLFIGPEGGWAPKEVEWAAQAGVLPVRLGPTLLRSETAAIVAATLVFNQFEIY